MSPNGLVVLTQPISAWRTQLPRLLDFTASLVSETVYIHVQPAIHSCSSMYTSLLDPVPCNTDVQSFLTDVYGISSTLGQKLDIRILLGHVSNSLSKDLVPKYRLSKALGVLICDAPFFKRSWESNPEGVEKLLRKSFYEGIDADRTRGLHMKHICLFESGPKKIIKMCKGRVRANMMKPTASPPLPVKTLALTALPTWPSVVLGGTFDRLHGGHHLLLSHACLRCNKELVVGVTAESMHANKVLPELIEPQEVREKAVQDLVRDIKPGIQVQTVMIHDVYGPTITRSDLHAIVVTSETAKGASIVNSERQKQRFPALEVVTLDLVEDRQHAPEEEEKISSSSMRRRLLGKLLKPVQPKPKLKKHPYRIGLTGGIASGKSTMCEELSRLGAATINCDDLGHQVYAPGTVGFKRIVREFGESVLADNQHIDRAKLGALVFSDKNQLVKLNNIVWPEILKMAEQEIDRCATENDEVQVVVLEAAVLLEAGWEEHVHEVWTTFVPREEAKKRVMERHKLSEKEAINRLNAQMSNKERIQSSHVIICPLWEIQYTHKQIQRAWNLLGQRIHS